ncbi:hypothetical protein [Adhaeribacter pallidiroseus]|uniref:Uncharacterized protein n=1 Tax=Adhaeribacter pallidiroseus TaxID=2072847 RepID=A0A369QS86_9BACT|nr:hypothetical protein [Adhaeribacter pallidiroseus]RDC65038.1 hypothetical protein AHMF7616_03661 [Adhaeribacter pallidiroseus]
MKKALLALSIVCFCNACGKGTESSANSDSTTEANSTTPPVTSDTANPIGVMMSDTSTSASDSLNSQK